MRGGSLIDYSKIEVKRHRGVRASSGTKAQTTNAVHHDGEREREGEGEREGGGGGGGEGGGVRSFYSFALLNVLWEQRGRGESRLGKGHRSLLSPLLLSILIQVPVVERFFCIVPQISHRKGTGRFQPHRCF